MRRRDVGRHRRGKALGFARSRRPIRAGGPGSLHGWPGLTRRSSPPPAGRVSRVSRLPVPGATIGAPPGLAAASPVPAHGRVRAQALKGRTGNGPGSKREARNQKRRSAGPCRIRRSGSEPCLPIRFARTTRGARTPTRAPRSPPGVTRKPLFDSATALPASPAGDFARPLETGAARMVGATGIEPVTLRV